MIANCHAGNMVEIDKPKLPNKPCKAAGLVISHHNTLVKLVHPKIEGPFSQAWAEPVDRIKINSMDTEIINR